MSFFRSPHILCSTVLFLPAVVQAQDLTPLENQLPLEAIQPLQTEVAVESTTDFNLKITKPAVKTRALPLPVLPNSFGQTPSEVYPFLTKISQAFPTRAKIRNYGKSVQGRPLMALEIRPATAPKSNSRRLVVICRQHGNEPEATASGTKFLKQFLKPTTDLQRRIAQKTTLLIIPIANPDGAAIYKRRTAQNIDMNRDWTSQKAPEVRALVQLVSNWKPNLIVDNHQWLPAERQPIPMAEASGGSRAKTAARLMSQKSAKRGYYLSARSSRSGASETLCHRFWGKRGKVPSILLETRHNPTVKGAREKAINQAVAALWGAAESLGH
jgi:hypothetical protein